MAEPVKVQEVMVSPVVTVAPETSLKEACRLMGEHHIGSVVVVKGEEPVGIFTERDLLSKIVAKGLSLEGRVEEFMSKPLTVIPPDFDLKDAARIMFEMKIRRLPVVEEGRLVGIITSADIARVVGERFGEL
jgi:CBS domain-containing protein